MSAEEDLSAKILGLQRERDNIIYLLLNEELSDVATLRLQTQLSSIEDELVLLLAGKAA